MLIKIFDEYIINCETIAFLEEVYDGVGSKIYFNSGLFIIVPDKKPVEVLEEIVKKRMEFILNQGAEVAKAAIQAATEVVEE